MVYVLSLSGHMWKRKIYDSIFDFLLVTMSVKTPKTQKKERERERERDLRGWLRVSTTKQERDLSFRI